MGHMIFSALLVWAILDMCFEDKESKDTNVTDGGELSWFGKLCFGLIGCGIGLVTIHLMLT